MIEIYEAQLTLFFVDCVPTYDRAHGIGCVDENFTGIFS